MTPNDLARNLAYSLSSASWSAQDLEQALQRRLPATLNRLAPEVAAHLIAACPQSYAPNTKTIARELRATFQFDLILRYCRRHDAWPAPDVTPPTMRPTPAFQGLDLPPLPTVVALADWLLLDLPTLDYLADPESRHEVHGDAAVNHYRYLLRRKTRGGTRVIEAPKARLKALQRAILHGIVAHVPDHDSAYAFLAGRNCLDGAARHAGEPLVVSFDLKDFFPSISWRRVFGLFRRLGYPNAVARYLTGICMTRTPLWLLERLPFAVRQIHAWPHLPQGSPVSPALANKVVFSLDIRLAALAKRLDATYTRYADDLSFSGDRGIAGVILRAVPEIVREEGFAVNPAKTRIMSRTSRQMVTGVVVNQHLNVKRTEFDRLKAVIHACGRPSDHRLTDAAFRARLLGQIGWVEQVNPHRGQKLLRLLAAALENRS